MTYNQNAIELEAFSRPLWALVPFWVGGGSEPEFETIYRKGLAAGADPETPEYRGTTGEYDQCYAEMAAIACGILPTHRKSCKILLSDTKNRTLLAGADQRPHHPGLQLAVFPHPCKPCPEKRGDALQPGTAGGWPLQN